MYKWNSIFFNVIIVPYIFGFFLIEEHLQPIQNCQFVELFLFHRFNSSASLEFPITILELLLCYNIIYPLTTRKFIFYMFKGDTKWSKISPFWNLTDIVIEEQYFSHLNLR